jgi:choline kinase
LKAVILAAGVASRLRPLTDQTPKCLLNVGHETILGRTLESLRLSGVNELVMVTGYREDQIRDFVMRTFPHLAVTWLSNAEYASTNNIYSLWLTRKSIAGHDMLLLDSDIVFDSRIIRLLIDSGHENCLAVSTSKPLAQEEIKVRVSADGMILEIGKEVTAADALGESIGIEKFSRQCVERLFGVLERKMLNEKSVTQFYEAAFQEVIDGGEKIAAVDVGDYPCIEIDTLEDLESARAMIAGLESRGQ